jgi:hypothetical protein
MKTKFKFAKIVRLGTRWAVYVNGYRRIAGLSRDQARTTRDILEQEEQAFRNRIAHRQTT